MKIYVVNLCLWLLELCFCPFSLIRIFVSREECGPQGSGAIQSQESGANVS